MKILSFVIAAAVLAAVHAPVYAAGDDVQGRTSAAGAGSAGAAAVKGASKSAYCYGCHQIEGYRNASPPYSVPKLAGQHPEYIVAALKAYQSGARKHPTMRAVAASLKEQDMADIAAYYAQPANQNKK